MSPSVGQPVQCVTLSAVAGVRSEPGVSAAIVSHVHDSHTVGLTVFPGPDPSTEFFTSEEIMNGIAHRTSVVRGQLEGHWRPIPEP